MRSNLPIVIICMSIGLLSHLTAVTPTLAVLGEPSTTVEQDRNMLKAIHRTQPEAGFTVHVLEAPGLTVREYATPDGVVFGFTWTQQSGPLSLETLFGAYYQEYSNAVAGQSGRSRRFHQITTEHLVVERGGRMGAVWGRAWIVSLIPAGMSKDQIQ